MKQFIVRATFPEIRPAHKNYFVARVEARSFATAAARGLRDIYKQLSTERKKHMLHGRPTEAKIGITVVKALKEEKEHA